MKKFIMYLSIVLCSTSLWAMEEETSKKSENSESTNKQNMSLTTFNKEESLTTIPQQTISTPSSSNNFPNTPLNEFTHGTVINIVTSPNPLNIPHQPSTANTKIEEIQSTKDYLNKSFVLHQVLIQSSDSETARGEETRQTDMSQLLDDVYGGLLDENNTLIGEDWLSVQEIVKNFILKRIKTRQHESIFQQYYYLGPLTKTLCLKAPEQFLIPVLLTRENLTKGLIAQAPINLFQTISVRKDRTELIQSMIHNNQNEVTTILQQSTLGSIIVDGIIASKKPKIEQDVKDNLPLPQKYSTINSITSMLFGIFVCALTKDYVVNFFTKVNQVWKAINQTPIAKEMVNEVAKEATK